MSFTETFRASIGFGVAVLIGCLPLIYHQLLIENDALDSVRIHHVQVTSGEPCIQIAVVSGDLQLPCTGVFEQESIQEWAWTQQIIGLIETEGIETRPIRLNTIQFYAGETFGPLRYAIYRLLLREGYLDLSPNQKREEIDYLIPELPFPIQGKDGERWLSSVEEVIEWKTEVVQQAEFSNRYIEYMLDIQDDLTILSADAWLQYDGQFSLKGNVLTQVLWQKEGCVIRNRWWSLVQSHNRLNIPLYATPNITKNCLKRWKDWIQNPSLDEVTVIVDWMGLANDERVQSRGRWRSE